MGTNNIKWLDFLSGINTIKITNEYEFNRFKKFLDDIGLGKLLNNYRDYYDWQHLSVINNHDPNCILFEYQPGKGMTFGSTIEESKDWHGEEPLTVNDLDSFYKNSNIINKELEEEKYEDIERSDYE